MRGFSFCATQLKICHSVNKNHARSIGFECCVCVGGGGAISSPNLRNKTTNHFTSLIFKILICVKWRGIFVISFLIFFTTVSKTFWGKFVQIYFVFFNVNLRSMFLFLKSGGGGWSYVSRKINRLPKSAEWKGLCLSVIFKGLSVNIMLL